MVDPVTAVLAIGIVARLTRLVQHDTITAPIRLRLPTLLYNLVTCGWCVSIWISFPTAVTWWAWGHCAWWQITALALTASWIAGAVQDASQPSKHDVVVSTVPPPSPDEDTEPVDGGQ